MITESMVRKMRPGSVIIDLSIDQGGCVETSRPTTLSDPVFKKHGVIHYCVPNVPSSVARTASHALNNVVVPFVEDIAENGRLLFDALLPFGGECTCFQGIAPIGIGGIAGLGIQQHRRLLIPDSGFLIPIPE